ncbi:MAG TPA: hypothetical protein VLD67_16700 [Vicinamibacterales bacterium]|nr:hypothetical protein [Gemmatimonadaceae bacterium]HSC28918.1 hypothetical protein [Vicinamibacterales bacterium]
MSRLLKLTLLTALYAGVVTALGIGLADWVAQWTASRGLDGGASAAVVRR